MTSRIARKRDRKKNIKAESEARLARRSKYAAKKIAEAKASGEKINGRP